MEIDIQSRSLDFGVRVIKFCKILSIDSSNRVIARQLIRSGTSIGANLEEANAASSRKDFINKVSISCKECRETRYWLTLILKAELVFKDKDIKELRLLLKESDELVRILSSIIKNTKNNIINTERS